MHYFIGHRMVSGQDGFTVILYLDEQRAEFASELGELTSSQQEHIHQTALEYIKEKFPHFKVNLVKVVLGSTLIASFPLGGGPALAAEPSQATAPTMTTQAVTTATTNYTVVSGDTLYLIARRFNTTIDAIKQASGFTGDMIYVGQILKIPTTATTTPTPTPTPAPTPTPVQQTSYKVVSGDSLYNIARKFNTTVDAIKKANNLTGDMIYVGQALLIPTTTVTPAPAPAPAPAPTPTPTPAPAPTPAPVQQTTYKVVAGDTLWTIARQLNTTVDALKQANNLTGDTIYIGQTLVVPGTNTTTPAPAPVQQPTLTIGATGTLVEDLQKDLQSLGYFINSAITGNFDSITGQAVRNFQTANGLPVTGVVDQATQTQIDHAIVKKAIVADSANYLGIPYVWGGASPTGFDCSGFVYYMFNSHGVDMPRTTSKDLYNMGTPINRTLLQPGDLVFFAINEPGVISHVGIYIGNNQFISATSSKGIASVSMDNTYWSQYYVGAQRVY